MSKMFKKKSGFGKKLWESMGSDTLAEKFKHWKLFAKTHRTSLNMFNVNYYLLH